MIRKDDLIKKSQSVSQGLNELGRPEDSFIRDPESVEKMVTILHCSGTLSLT